MASDSKRSKKIKDFLNDHPLISVNALEKLTGTPPGAIRPKKKSDINPKYLFLIEYALKRYGFEA